MSEFAIAAGIVLDPAAWLDITPPDDYDNVLIANQSGATVRLRIDKSNPSSELLLTANVERMIAAPKRTDTSGAARFARGRVAFSLKPDSGTGPVLVLWA